MRYSRSPENGQHITLDDLAEFVAEMRGYRQLPGHTVVRGFPAVEIDFADGPRLQRISADPDSTPAREPIAEQEDTPRL
jgi:hypothetical protein